MHTIQINDDTYTLPGSMDELTPKQLLYLVKLTKSNIPVEQVKIYMMLYCLKAHVCRHKKIFKEYVRIKIGRKVKQSASGSAAVGTSFIPKRSACSLINFTS